MPVALAAIVFMTSQARPIPRPVTRAVVRSAQAAAKKNHENITMASNGDICFSFKRKEATSACDYSNTLLSYEAPVALRTARGTLYAVQENGMGSGGIVGVLFFRSDGTLLRSVDGQGMLLGRDAGDVAIMSSVGAGAKAWLFVQRFPFDGQQLGAPVAVRAFPGDTSPRPSYPYAQGSLTRSPGAERCAIDACNAARVADVFSSPRGTYVLLAWGCGVPTYEPVASGPPTVGSYLFVNDKTKHWWPTTGSAARADWKSCD